MRIALVMVVAACGGVKPSAPPANVAPPRPVPALVGAGPHAFVASERGLVEVAATGASQPIASTQPFWCAVDARAQVVWIAAEGGVFAFDLLDRLVHPIVAGEVPTMTIAIDHGNEHLGAYSAVDYDVALALHLTATPAVGAQLGCEGDHAVYCYEDGAPDRLQAPLAERKRKLDALRLVDPAYVATLVARGAHRSLWSPPPLPPVKPAAVPPVDRAACIEDPARCGELTAIPGSALWLVTTANSRGDYYHESRELWDPVANELIAIAQGALVRTKVPSGANADYAGLRIATSGLLSIDGVVFAPDRVVYAVAGDGGMTCGWTDGWRMHGIRGD